MEEAKIPEEDHLDNETQDQEETVTLTEAEAAENAAAETVETETQEEALQPEETAPSEEIAETETETEPDAEHEDEQPSGVEVPAAACPEPGIRQAPSVDGIVWTGVLEVFPEEEEEFPEYPDEDEFRYEDVFVPREEKATIVVDRKDSEQGETDDEEPELGTTHDTIQYGLTDEDYYATGEASQENEEVRIIQANIKTRKESVAERVRRIQVRTWSILAVALLTIAFLILSMSNLFTVDAIEVRGNSHYTSEEIINIAHAVPGKNLIYHPDKKEITDYLEQNPYIKHAEVRRKLPSTLVIEVEERKQACAFRYDDDFLIMDQDGILLRKTRTEPKLTMVKGLVVSRIKLGEVVGTEDNKRFRKTLEIVRNMMSADMYFVRIEMGEDDAVRAYIYETLLVKTTATKLIDNLKNGHLHLVIERLFNDGIERGTLTIGDDGSISFEPGI